MYLGEKRSFFQLTGLYSVSHSSAFVPNAAIETSLDDSPFDLSTSLIAIIFCSRLLVVFAKSLDFAVSIGK